jgi:hypothetical protein
MNEDAHLEMAYEDRWTCEDEDAEFYPPPWAPYDTDDIDGDAY